MSLRSGLSADADVEEFVDTERLGFRSQHDYGDSELGDYRFTVRAFEHGYLTRVVVGDHGAFVTCDRMHIDRCQEVAQALRSVPADPSPDGSTGLRVSLIGPVTLIVILYNHLTHMSDETLYAQLGGADAIDVVVDEFYDRVLADESLASYFENTDTEALRDHQKEFITFVTGGAEEYDGPDMATAHAHLDVTEEAFGRVAEHLDASLRACDVADEDREELMSAVAGLQDAVVSA